MRLGLVSSIGHGQDLKIDLSMLEMTLITKILKILIGLKLSTSLVIMWLKHKMLKVIDKYSNMH